MAGLETINWYADLADWLSRRGEQSVVLLGMIFLLLILRDVMTSGDLLTGEETPAYPRAGRIAHYFGYDVVSSALVLFVGTVHVGDAAPFGGDFASQDLSLDALAQIGLIALGIPVVALTFILRIGQWRAGVPGTRRPATVAAVERTLLARLRTEELGVAVAGLVALGAIVMSGVSSARALSASARQTPASQPAGTYSAPAPGRACDKGNALWTDGARYTCTPVGTSVKVAAHTSGLLAFTPPHGDFAHTYQIAVRVDFRGLDAGCLSVAAGESRTDFDEYALCKGGSWAIRRFTVGSSAPPALVAQGKAPAADSYEFAVRMGASDLRLLINGVAVGGDSHTPLVVRECLLLVSNLGGRAGTVVLSDFVYTPLA
jgi:hypothetical protein